MVQFSETFIQGLKVIKPQVHRDNRGYFFESYHAGHYSNLGSSRWVQDNESSSSYGTLRGLHYQVGDHAQAKLVRVITGKVYDVTVDLRQDSKTFGQWYGIILSGENQNQLFVPRGFAHGFLVLSRDAIFSYKCDNFYHQESEAGILYDDPDLAIEWPIPASDIVLSEKDKSHPNFSRHIPTT